jgi:hypothetical protein
MSITNQTKLWRNSDDKGELLFTKLPNALTNAIALGIIKGVQLRILAVILKMTYGFGREESNYLGLNDFKEATGIEKPHLSKIIKKMLNEGILFRGKESGGKYKYAINLLPYGIGMKYYRIVEAEYKLGDGEYTLDRDRYVFCNESKSDKTEILYKPAGFDDKKNPYRKEDRKIDKQLERKIERGNNSASASGSSGAIVSEANQNKPISKSLNDSERDKREREIYAEFRETMKRDCKPETIAQFMERFFEIGSCPYLLTSRYVRYIDEFRKEGICLDQLSACKAEALFDAKHKGYRKTIFA